MNARGIVFAIALLAIGSAQAQLAEPSSARLETEPLDRHGPLAAGFKRYTPLYGGNEAANPNDRQFQGFRTDPRLVLGVNLNKYLALETGYSYLWDEGFHKIDTFGRRSGATEAAVAAGDLRAKSNTTYFAAKLTLPVTDRLTAYGKFGVAHSVVKNDGFVSPQQAEAIAAGKPVQAGGESNTGPYGAVGAKYKLNDRTTLSGEVRSNGSANAFGRASNASGVKGSVGIGF